MFFGLVMYAENARFSGKAYNGREHFFAVPKILKAIFKLHEPCHLHVDFYITIDGFAKITEETQFSRII